VFLIETEKGILKLTKEQAFEEILNAAMKQNKNEKLISLDEFVEIIFNKLKSHMLKAEHKQLYGIYFLAGYYYKIFLEKNNVKFNKKE
jgi:hypothetical protein